MKNGWSIVAHGPGSHVVPTDEDHFFEDCWCEPTPNASDGSVLVHHSRDGREQFANGQRKVS